MDASTNRSSTRRNRGPPMLPWNERVPMLSINPDAASRDDVARMAAELMELRNVLCKIKTWCELNKRNGSVIYKTVCDAIELGK